MWFLNVYYKCIQPKMCMKLKIHAVTYKSGDKISHIYLQTNEAWQILVKL